MKLFTNIKMTLAMVVAFAVGISSANATLVNHYTFDTDASDSGSQGRNGTLVGAVIDNGDSAVGGGSVNVTNGHVDLPNMDATAYGQYTIAAWIKIDSDTGFISALYATDGFDASALHFNYETGGTPSFVTSIGGFALSDDTSVPARPTDWFHLAVTHDSGVESLMYVNGVQVDSDVIGTTATLFIDASIGTWSNQARPFNGKIDDLRIYDEVLDANQIGALVPEPASLALLGLGSLLLIRRKTNQL